MDTPHAEWSLAEPPLRESARADILVILDCCFAGMVFGPLGQSERAYEVLVAADKTDTTPFPGPGSFTATLIAALRWLKSQGRAVTTWELHQTIGWSRGWNTTVGLHSVFLSRNPRHISLALSQPEQTDGDVAIQE